MAMHITTEYYAKARKLALKEYHARMQRREYPYLPVLDEVEEKQDELSKKMAKVSGEIKSAQAKVSNLSYQINETSDDIATTEKRIKKKQKEMLGAHGAVQQLIRIAAICPWIGNMNMFVENFHRLGT